MSHPLPKITLIFLIELSLIQRFEVPISLRQPIPHGALEIKIIRHKNNCQAFTPPLIKFPTVILISSLPDLPQIQLMITNKIQPPLPQILPQYQLALLKLIIFNEFGEDDLMTTATIAHRQLVIRIQYLKLKLATASENSLIGHRDCIIMLVGLGIILLQLIMNQPAAPAWSLRGKKCTIDELNDGYVDSSPGPVYNMHGTGIKTKILSFTTGKSQRTVINQGAPNNPSPSHYKPNNPSLLTHSVSFPKNNKFAESDTLLNPDPAAYQFNPNFVKQAYPNYSMGSKYPCFTENTGSNPGPGFYNNNPEVFLSSQLHKNSRFGSEKRFSTPNLAIPGPGDYNISTKLIKDKLALSKSRRSLDIKTTPGPGDYRHFDQFLNNESKGMGKTLSKKLESCFNTESNTVQAFNNYFKDEKKSGRSWTVGKQKREVFNGNDLPAPTDYKVSTAQVVKQGVKVGFAKSSWVENNQAVFNPGPGHYKDQQFDVTTYTIPKSKSLQNFNKNPGAGRYNIPGDMGENKQKFKNQISGNLIGKSQRTNFISRNTAGVGDYQIIGKKTSGISIPKANRFPKPNKNPGPGDYHMSSTISNFNMYRKRN